MRAPSLRVRHERPGRIFEHVGDPVPRLAAPHDRLAFDLVMAFFVVGQVAVFSPRSARRLGTGRDVLTSVRPFHSAQCGLLCWAWVTTEPRRWRHGAGRASTIPRRHHFQRVEDDRHGVALRIGVHPSQHGGLEFSVAIDLVALHPQKLRCRERWPGLRPSAKGPLRHAVGSLGTYISRDGRRRLSPSAPHAIPTFGYTSLRRNPATAATGSANVSATASHSSGDLAPRARMCSLLSSFRREWLSKP